jgi:hypothetical protein
MVKLEAPEVDLHVWGGGKAGEAQAEEQRLQRFITNVGAEGKHLRTNGWGGGDSRQLRSSR